MNNTVCSITNSDCNMNEGVQSDIQTFIALGAIPSRINSALSVQDVFVESVSNKMFSAQLDNVLEKMKPSVIKIGFIANREQVNILCKKIRSYKEQKGVPAFIIYTPSKLNEVEEIPQEESINALIKTDLLPLIDLLIMNAKDIFSFSGHMLITPNALYQSAQYLLNKGCKSVLICGGKTDFIDGCCVDYWSDGQREIALSSPRLTFSNTQSKKDILSCALASALSLKYVLEDAFVIAKAYLNGYLKETSKGYAEGQVSAWPENKSYFPKVVTLSRNTDEELTLDISSFLSFDFPRCNIFNLGLYPVLDSLSWLEKVLKCGVKTVQLRIKDKTSTQVEGEIIQAIQLGRKYNARLFINDYWELAIKHQAYGVHLGQKDIDSADLQLIHRAGLHLGLSTHGYYEILRAKQFNPSYIALGHVFATQTKEMPSAPQGLIRLKKYVELLADTPTVAIGGISLARASQVYKTGVGSVAVVSAITRAINFDSVIQEFKQMEIS